MSTIKIFPESTEEARVIFSRKNFKKNGYTNGELDNFEDWEKEYYTDEDEVFMEGSHMDKASQSKPLMHPRHRTKVKSRNPDCGCRKIAKPLTCFILLVTTLGSLMLLILYVYNKYLPHSNVKNKQLSQSLNEDEKTEIIGCDNIEVEDVWVMGFPKLLTESAIRLVDVNKDGVLDAIMGFATGADGYYIPSTVCDIYFNGTHPCFGGMFALDGLTGKELWRMYADHELYGINCNADLNKDGTLDCLGGGRAGAFYAVNGKDGSIFWKFETSEVKNDIMNLYTPYIIRDLDGDGIVDILAIHGGDPLQKPGSKFRLSGKIVFFSGKTGKVLKWLGVPDDKESYYSPQLYTVGDGTEIVLFGTGGETHGGSLWSITLDDLYKGNIKNARRVYEDKFKGIMTPPVLVDLTGDGVEDIVMSMFNSTVMAIDGASYKSIWRHDFPMSESYNTPSPGYYNKDKTPDFMVKFAHGPGYPLYYFSQTTVLDGKSGKPLIDPTITDTVGAQASPLTISVEDYGNDIFLYWISDCENHEGEGGIYKFVKGTNVHEQSRADFCHLRFKTKGFSKVYAINSNIPKPGTTIYSSVERKTIEHKYWINTTAEAERYLFKHPELYKDYSDYREQEKETEAEKPFNKFKDVNTARGILNQEQFAFNLPYENDNPQISSKKGRFNSLYQHKQKKGPQNNQYQRQQLPQDMHLPISEGGTYNQGYDTDVENILANAFENEYANRYKTGYRNKYGARNDGYGGRNDDDYSRYGNFGQYYPRQHPTSLPPYSNGKRRHLKQKRSATSSQTKFNESIEKRVFEQLKWLQGKLSKEKKDRFFKGNRRMKRHVGAHDDEGLQRLLSTGTIAPTTLPKDHPHYNHSIEYIFATYWFFPAKTQAILPKDEECISNKLAAETKRFDPNSKYYGLDHDAYEHVITQECLKDDHSDEHENKIYESQTSYNPYNVHMGQMTVYRLRITCTCRNSSLVNQENKRCSRILPFEQQQWTGYMGNKGDSHWKPKDIQKPEKSKN